MKQLLEDYQRRLATILKMIEKFPGQFTDGNDLIRLNIKASCFREFITGIERELNKPQFTGLLDKNGNEIYEGDNIHHELIDGIVVFDSGCFSVTVTKLNSKHSGYDIGSCPPLYNFNNNCIAIKN